jgi:hypothetical protein
VLAYPSETICVPRARIVQHVLLGAAQGGSLEPDNFIANVRHGLTLASVFHAVKAQLIAHPHVAQNLAALAIKLDHPTGRAGQLVQRLNSRPQRPIRAQLQRIRSSQVCNLAQKLSVEPVPAVRLRRTQAAFCPSD